MRTQRNLVARVTIPALLLWGYVDMLRNANSISQMAWSAVIGSPFFALAVWLLLVPSFVKFDDANSNVIVFQLLKKAIIPYDKIECIAKALAGFATIKLKSGQKILFIWEDGDRNRLSKFHWE